MLSHSPRALPVLLQLGAHLGVVSSLSSLFLAIRTRLFFARSRGGPARRLSELPTSCAVPHHLP